MEWATKILSWTLWMPVIGAFVLLWVPRRQELMARGIATVFALITLGLAGVLVASFDPNDRRYQFMERVDWLPDYGVQYLLGVDGVSLWLVALTALLSVLALFFSFSITERVKEFLILMLLLESALLGVFMALDLILFYVFFELTLVPTYFLIALWGGRDRASAALKFFLYTFFGSLFMLLASIVLAFEHYKATNVMTFELMRLEEFLRQGGVAADLRTWLFLGFAIAFAVKLPLVPFHTWWPHAMGEAPLPVVVVFLKTGAYGFLRFALPMFPEEAQAFAPLGMALAAIAVVYAAILATMQFDMRQVALYAVLSHAGFIMMGLFARNEQGFVGSVLQQINHGVTMGAMFLLLGFLYLRTRTLDVDRLGGLKHQMPLFSALFLIVLLASVALPGTNGFVGEFLCLLGAFQSAQAGDVPVGWVVLGVLGTILSVVYMLWMFQRAFYGPTPEHLRGIPDLRPHEVALVLPLIALIFWIGVRPVTFTKPITTAYETLHSQPAGVLSAHQQR
ncbi:MAG: NADH-quinone oxidoreductase subunit M [Fimbriimonadales bacterium]|jgi:NADH-quinone oxidoreductase subunit M|nr:NADH-quinone oxidoreductase subunit M [Fimbriimonadales bacterium]GBC90331.1 NADH-quinone oxidoreductase subunit M [bacterium HR14]GIV14145.1 MAG: NADH:ubiquinone oxidoreductase subunit M [Fimbriimonadales bacterium]CUU11142.1 NADH-quinone oxidoreductase subunit M [Armatimonadetes bacterium GBS]CUU36561.1 NADH-quinone oxidoreductase subunit M [Armatimonadetes bacterium GXS]